LAAYNWEGLKKEPRLSFGIDVCKVSKKERYLEISIDMAMLKIEESGIW
jgi:hypothetical protein